MQYTANLNLKKPEGTDTVNIADFNDNADILDGALAGKVDKVAGKGLSTEDYTTAEKTKLSGIAAGAQVNAVTSVAGKTGAVVLAAGDIASGVLAAARLPAATTSAAGAMSAADKVKLDGVAAGAQVNTVTSVAGRTGAVALAKADVALGSVENYPVATQAQAQAGTHAASYMTPQRTAQAIAGLAPAAPVQSVNGQTGAVSLSAADVGADASGSAAAVQANLNTHDANATKHITAAERTAWNAKASTAVATTSANGLMSSTDKAKLDGVAAGAQVNTVTSVAGKTGAVVLAAADIASGTLAAARLPAATTSAQGAMSAADKAKLDGVASGAQVNRAIATQAQAEAGTDNTTDMTPLRTKQYVDKRLQNNTSLRVANGALEFYDGSVWKKVGGTNVLDMTPNQIAVGVQGATNISGNNYVDIYTYTGNGVLSDIYAAWLPGSGTVRRYLQLAIVIDGNVHKLHGKNDVNGEIVAPLINGQPYSLESSSSMACIIHSTGQYTFDSSFSIRIYNNSTGIVGFSTHAISGVYYT